VARRLVTDNRIAPVASMTDAADGSPVDWPDTHLLLVARRS
jgi:hypothetical protein